MMAAVGGVTGEVAGLFVSEEQAKVEVHRSMRCAGSRPDDAVVRPRLAGSATPSCCRRPGSVQGTARRDESRPQWLAVVLPCLAAAGRAA